MNRVLVARSFRDSWSLLASCCVLLAAFICLRVWVASHLKMEAFIKLITEGLKFVQALLPVPAEDIASPLGRVAFGWEEFPTIVLMALWTIWRGSDCLVGRVSTGAMEMLLAQPIRRVSLVTSHTVVTLAGVIVLAAASWLGSGLGLAVAEFEESPELAKFLPAAGNYLGLGVFILGAATLASAVARTRSQAVGIVIGFYVIQLTLMIMGRLTEQFAWLEWLTIFSAYEPTYLTIGLHRDPAKFWSLYWQYNAWLLGLGAGALLIAGGIFCHRDVPAPL
jgi:ABC-2 type transport system permease protein